MTHRERVLKCFAHQEADRVPVDFGGWLCGIKPAAYKRLCAYMGVPFKAGDDSYTPSEKILEHFDIDFRRVDAKKPAHAQTRGNPDGSTTDEWGITRIYSSGDNQIVDFVLKNASIADLASYPWPDDSGTGRYEHTYDAAQVLREKGFAVVAQPDIDGVFELSCWLCGFERMLMDIVADLDFVHALFEKITQLQEKFALNYYSACGSLVDMTQFGDDLAMQTGPFFSLEMYRELIVPYQKRYMDAVKKRTQAAIFHHCCGSVYQLIPGLMEAGVQVLNPVQISAADMDPARLKKEFGKQITFHGGIDVQKVLPYKKPQEVRDEVKRILDIMAPGGGYILAPSHNIQDDVPPENIVAMYEAALEFG